ncbi:MAG: 50S ribosomal protein L29 [Nanoarchaeota archaeon]
MSKPDLRNKIIELKKELMKLNSQVAVGTALKNPNRVKELKRTIAKILTLNSENIHKDNGGTKKE